MLSDKESVSQGTLSVLSGLFEGLDFVVRDDIADDLRKVIWEEGPSLSLVRSHLEPLGWLVEYDHGAAGVWYSHPAGSRLVLERWLSPRTLALGVAHHGVDVLGMDEERIAAWMVDAFSVTITTERLLWDRWQADVLPTPSPLAEVAGALLLDAFSESTLFGGDFVPVIRRWVGAGPELCDTARLVLS